MGIDTGTQSNQWCQINYSQWGMENAQGCQHGNIQGSCAHCAYGYQQYTDPMQAYANYYKRAQQPEPTQEQEIIEKEVKGERVINPIDEYKIGDVVTLESPPRYEKTLGDAAKEINGERVDNKVKLLEKKS